MKVQLKMMLVTATAIALGFSSCKKDKDLPEVDENELITTVSLRFTNKANAADVKTFTFKDIDGPSGASPIIDEIVLSPNASYDMEVASVLNEAETPAEDIREEIEEESDEHLFVYKPVGNLTINATDKDVNNLPIGLKASATTGAAGTGTLRMILRHQPDSKDGSETPGSSDLDISFNLKIQ